jgi:outer membrane protein OmpA-like peptidoglycan-associated protein
MSPKLNLAAAACAVLAAGVMSAAGTNGALAGDEPTVDQIIKALSPKNLKRSLTVTAAVAAQNAEEDKFIETLKSRKVRSLSAEEREKVASIAQDKPNIDLEINFEYRSAKLASSSLPQARTLGLALSSPDFTGATFVVEGHTDAKGGDAYNLDLSEKRAETIKRFLVENYKISPADLVPVGFGKTKLKRANDPFAAENRRVRLVNMAHN